MTVLWIAIAALIVAAAVVLFNRLIRLRNAANTAWADIDVQLKRRHDLVRNLVETVRGYADFEREVLERVAALRGRAVDALGSGDLSSAGEAESRLSGGVRHLFALAEAYPNLKASEHFLELQRGLISLEEDIQNARRYYNAVVRDFNTRIQSFPDLLIARPFGFRERKFFELENPAEAAAPRVAREDRA